MEEESYIFLSESNMLRVICVVDIIILNLEYVFHGVVFSYLIIVLLYSAFTF